MFRRVFIFALSGLLWISAVYADDEGFPGRAEFPAISVIEQSELLDRLDEVTVVDARSSLEFDTLRISGAVNIPVAGNAFEAAIKALRDRTDKPIVFYCNGRTCMKSYLAAKKAASEGITDTYAYDAGVFEWAQAYPEHAELLGKSPVKPEDIISRNKFQQHLLDPDKFSHEANSQDSQSLIIDVRDKYQRGATGLFPGVERWASLDDRQKLEQYIEKAKKESKTLLVYDEVGKQVRWLQYMLERANLKDYYFMHEGAEAYYAEMMREFGIK